MKEEYHKWYTNYLSREFQMLVFGHSGLPLILFPTSNGRYYEAKDHGLIESASEFIDSGKIKIYCPDGIDWDSWYNYKIHPSDRVKTHNGYENVILHDVIKYAFYDSQVTKVALAGCSLGGYHAANMAFRFPDIVSHMISLGGTFDIKQFLHGYYDDNCYFNNPPDYLPGLTDEKFLAPISEMKLILGTGEKDICLGENRNMAEILRSKNIPYWLDVIPNGEHDWPYWNSMFPRYLESIT